MNAIKATKRNKPRNRRLAKREKASNAFTMVSPNQNVFPDSVWQSLPYLQVGFIGSSTLSLVTQTYNANSAFDPDYTGVGSQPLGYDQWSAFYSRYFIDKASVDAVFSNTTSRPLVIGVMPDVDATPPTTIKAFLENQRTAWLVVGPSGSSIPATLNHSVSVQSLYGNPGINDAFDEFTGQTGNLGAGGSSPLRNFFYHIFVSSLDGAALGSGAVGFVLRLTQHTKFMRRLDLAGS